MTGRMGAHLVAWRQRRSECWILQLCCAAQALTIGLELLVLHTFIAVTGIASGIWKRALCGSRFFLSIVASIGCERTDGHVMSQLVLSATSSDPAEHSRGHCRVPSAHAA